MFVLEACSLKNCGSLARNASFGSLFLEKLRKSRAKCSFWRLFKVVRSGVFVVVFVWWCFCGGVGVVVFLWICF